MNDHTAHRQWDPDDSGVRVLLECAPASSPSIVADVIARHGFSVRCCEGPGDGRGCELIERGHCSLVAGADVVVNMLRGPGSDARQVLDAVTSERRPPAVVAEMTRPQLHATDQAGSRPVDRSRVTVVTTPLSSSALVAGIHSALGRCERRAEWWGDGFP